MARVDPKKMQALMAKRGGKGKAKAAPPPAKDEEKDDDDDEEDTDDEEDAGGATDHEEPDEDDAGGPPDGDEDDEGAPEDDEEVVEQVAEAMAAGDRDPQLEELMAGFEPDGPPPAWAQDRDVWDRAVAAVDPDNGGRDEPWLLVAHVYAELGGQVNPGNKPGNDGDGAEDTDDGSGGEEY